MKTKIILSASILALAVSAEAQTTETEWKAAAVKKYLLLGVKGSVDSGAFWARVKELRAIDAAILNRADWAMSVADDLALKHQAELRAKEQAAEHGDAAAVESGVSIKTQQEHDASQVEPEKKKTIDWAAKIAAMKAEHATPLHVDKATEVQSDASALRLAVLAWEEKQIELNTAGVEAIGRMIAAVKAGDERGYAAGREAGLGAIQRMVVHVKRAEVLEAGMGEEARARFREEQARLSAMHMAAFDRASNELDAVRNGAGQAKANQDDQPVQSYRQRLHRRLAAEDAGRTPEQKAAESGAREFHPHGTNGAREDADLQWAEQQRTTAAQAQAAELARIAAELARLRR